MQTKLIARETIRQTVDIELDRDKVIMFYLVVLIYYPELLSKEIVIEVCVEEI